MSEETTAPAETPQDQSLSQQLPESAESPQEAPAQDVASGPEIKENIDFDPLSVDGLRRDVDNQDTSIKEVAEGVNQLSQVVQGIRGETIQAFGRLQAWMNQLEGVAHNHNVRVNTIETIFCHAEFKEERKRFIAVALGELMLELEKENSPMVSQVLLDNYTELDLVGDLHRIAEKHVVPVLQEQQKKRQAQLDLQEKAAKAAAEKAKADGATPEEQMKAAQEAAARVAGGDTPTEDPAKNESNLVGLDGKPINRTVMEEESDE